MAYLCLSFSSSLRPQIQNDSLFTLFDFHQPIHGEPNQLFTWTPPPNAPNQAPLVVRIPPQENTQLFAHYVWSAGVRLADRIALGEVDVKGKTVLEMGAGTGIPALVSAREGAAKVLVTDYEDPKLICNLVANIPLALPSPSHQSITSALGFTWGNSTASLLSLSPNGYSLILLADTLWFSSGHDVLITSLLELLSFDDPGARVEIVAGFHSGRQTVRAFLRKAEERGLVREGKWEEVGFQGDRKSWGWDVELGLVEEEEIGDRNKAVVEGALNSQSQRVLWLLEELEVPYTLVTHIRDAKTMLAPPSLRDASPSGKSPCLVTADGHAIVESSAIMGYLIRKYDACDQFSGATLRTGLDPLTRDEILSSFSSSSLQPFNSLKLFTLLGVIADNTSGAFIEPKIAAALEWLEGELGDEDYFMGTSPGRADFMLSWPVDLVVQRGWGTLGNKLAAWRDRVTGREAWKRALEKPGVPYDLTMLKRN
ncbi:EEF1A N-terminal glycine/lysine methyltransferase, partial [Phenoliferia sp. Uapishka_3]